MRVASVALLAVDNFACQIPDAKAAPSVFGVTGVNAKSGIELIQAKADFNVAKKPANKKAGKKATVKPAKKSKQTAA